MRIKINAKNDSSTELDIFDVLFLIFITLKLTGLVTYSWLWVVAPVWIGFGLDLLIFICGKIYYKFCK